MALVVIAHAVTRRSTWSPVWNTPGDAHSSPTVYPPVVLRMRRAWMSSRAPSNTPLSYPVRGVFSRLPLLSLGHARRVATLPGCIGVERCSCDRCAARRHAPCPGHPPTSTKLHTDKTRRLQEGRDVLDLFLHKVGRQREGSRDTRVDISCTVSQ